MPLLFALTMFVSATLLFLVQPMIGKMVLPLLGGTPAVWNTCMVFYQALLLLGYYYAHKSTSHLETKKQTKLHAVILLGTLGFLLTAAVLTADNSPIPIVKSLSPQGDDYPFFGVIVVLTLAIGLPFFVVSTSAPLLQKWFAETGHPSAKDPYFLYAASNFGSLLALIAYPAVVEPNLRVIHQAWLWAIGYGILTALVITCARAVHKSRMPGPTGPNAKSKTLAPPVAPQWDPEPTLRRKLRWIALAFVPSSLMLGVTTFVSTDMASIPLLWIIPLSLYLITFIIVFAKVPPWIHLTMSLLMPVSVLLIVFVMTSHVQVVFVWLVVLHMMNFFIVTMVCHGELAHDRPSPRHLTTFYLLMSVGGMLGGLFNALFAPIVFTFTSEYPLTLIAACLLLPSMFEEKDRQTGDWTRILDVLLPLSVFFLCAQLQTNQTDLGEYFHANGKFMLTCLALYVVPAAVGVLILGKDMRFRIVTGILVGGSLLLYGLAGPILHYLERVQPALKQSFGPISLVELLRWAPVLMLAGAYASYWHRRGPKEKFASYLAYGLGTLAVSFAVMRLLSGMVMKDIVNDMALYARMNDETVKKILIFGVPAMICYFFVERPLRFGAAVGALWLATFLNELTQTGDGMFDRLFSARANKDGNASIYDRSFFGRLKIETFGQWLPISVDALPDRVLEDHKTYEIVEKKGTGENEPDLTVTIRTLADHKPAYRIETYKVEGGLYKRYAMHQEFAQLVHGTTVHGMQEVNRLRRDIATALLPAIATNWAGTAAMEISYGSDIQTAMRFPGRSPLTYYHRNGPVGSMFNAWVDRRKTQQNPNNSVGCIGMGTASLTAYGRPAQKMVIFEIDTHVRRLVEPPTHFNYVDLARSQGVEIEFVMGDARISLERQNRKFGMLLIDAFSSDAIPAHLLTKQAVQLYFDRLEDDGLLAVHISNRYLELEPVVERIVRELGLAARVMHGRTYDKDRDSRWEEGRYASTWIAIAKNPEALGAIEEDAIQWEKDIADGKAATTGRWMPLTGKEGIGLWTDDYSPIIPILKGSWKFWSRSSEE